MTSRPCSAPCGSKTLVDRPARRSSQGRVKPPACTRPKATRPVPIATRKARPGPDSNRTTEAIADPPSKIVVARTTRSSAAPRATLRALATASRSEARRARNVRRRGNEQGEKNAAKPVPAARAVIPAAIGCSWPTNATKPEYPNSPTIISPTATTTKRASVRWVLRLSTVGRRTPSRQHTTSTGSRVNRSRARCGSWSRFA